MRRDWRDRLQVGDVIANADGHGAPRIVRRAHYHKNGLLYAVTLVIRHCSWTGRCYTLLTRSDLRTFGYKRTRPRVVLKVTGIDARIAHAIAEPAWEKSLTCCDVEGLP